MTGPSMTTGEMIRTARSRLGWTQTQLAHVLGMRQSTVSEYERDIKPHPWPGELQHALDRLLWMHNQSPVGV